MNKEQAKTLKVGDIIHYKNEHSNTIEMVVDFFSLYNAVLTKVIKSNKGRYEKGDRKMYHCEDALVQDIHLISIPHEDVE